MTIHTLEIGGRTYELDVHADGERSVIRITEAGNKSAPTIEVIRDADGALAWKATASAQLREAIEEWAHKHFGQSPVG